MEGILRIAHNERGRGDTLIPVEQIDCFVPYDEPLIDIAHPDFRRRLYKEYLEYQRSCGMEEGLQEYMERHKYSRDWAIQ